MRTSTLAGLEKISYSADLSYFLVSKLVEVLYALSNGGWPSGGFAGSIHIERRL
jgi:hypothetical protein